MTNDQQVAIVAALLGAFVGATLGGLLTFAAQVFLDRARERARAREAAAMLRAELVRGSSAVAMLLAAVKQGKKGDDLRGFHLLTPAGSYFDTLGLTMAGRMPIEWFTEVMAVYARWTAAMHVARELEEGRGLESHEREFIEQWVRDADLAQGMLLVCSVRWWARVSRYRRQEGVIRKRVALDEKDRTGAIERAGLSDYLTLTEETRRR